MKVGSIVSYWFDTGATGMQLLYGVVLKVGLNNLHVRWESGTEQRLKLDRVGHLIKEVTDRESVAEATDVLKRRGLL